MLVMNYKVVPRDIKADLTELVGIELRRLSLLTQFKYLICRNSTAAAWLAQLAERQCAVREVGGASPRPDQHSGDCAAFG